MIVELTFEKLHRGFDKYRQRQESVFKLHISSCIWRVRSALTHQQVYNNQRIQTLTNELALEELKRRTSSQYRYMDTHKHSTSIRYRYTDTHRQYVALEELKRRTHMVQIH